jgi:hypothetical protein
MACLLPLQRSRGVAGLARRVSVNHSFTRLSRAADNLVSMSRNINVLTVHWHSSAWLEIQARALREHLTSPWSLLIASTEPDTEGVATYCEDLPGGHGEKLNALAREASRSARDEDILMFIDGDAFPVRPLRAWIENLLAAAPLAAVVRTENLGDPQPHPCFCVTTAGFWKSLPGDWERGPKWVNSAGREVGDVGGRLWQELRASGSQWTPILRANAVDWHPVFYGLYGERGGMVYHHGAGFRDPMSRADRYGHRNGPGLDGNGANGSGAPGDDMSPERIEAIKAANARLSAKVFDALQRDRSAVLRLFGET